MHNCSFTQEKIADLLFDELQRAEKESLLAEIRSCGDCLQEYRAMQVTLRVFDKAVEQHTPPESYWPGYEARLRERLEAADQSTWRRVAGWLTGWQSPLSLPFWRLAPVMAATIVILLLSTFGFWWIAQKTNPVATAPGTAAVTWTPPQTPNSPSLIPPQIMPDIASPKVTATAERKSEIAVVHRKSDQRKAPQTATSHHTPLGTVPTPGISAPDKLITGNSEMPVDAGAFFDPLTTRHLEQAQLTLRAFRNLAAVRNKADVRYEKKSSRSLLHRNILLRREAEASGNLPAQELLNTLEPLLIDIANLPDKASTAELRPVRERIERQEIIASLQIYTARPVIAASY
jgi:hypothetical protein